MWCESSMEHFTYKSKVGPSHVVHSMHALNLIVYYTHACTDVHSDCMYLCMHIDRPKERFNNIRPS